MKHHLLAFGGAAQDYTAGNVTVPVIADPLIRIVSNVLQLTDDWRTLWSFFGGVGLSKVRLNAASLRIRGFPNLTPFMALTTGGDNPAINDMTEQPYLLRAGENVNIQATNAAAAATIGLLALTRDTPNYNVNYPGIRKIRFTAAPTSVAYGWSSIANIVLDDDLEYGTYHVFGMQVFEATTLAARLVFKDQVERPGVLANQSATQRPWPSFFGGVGEFGAFEVLTPPFIEVFANAAAAIAVVGYLYAAKA